MPLTRKRKSNKRLCTKVAKASSREDDDVQEDSIHQETYRSEQSALRSKLSWRNNNNSWKMIVRLQKIEYKEKK